MPLADWQIHLIFKLLISLNCNNLCYKSNSSSLSYGAKVQKTLNKHFILKIHLGRIFESKFFVYYLLLENFEKRMKTQL